MENNSNVILKKQSAYFASNQSKNTKFRIEQLKKLMRVLKANENLLNNALYKDFKKSAFETYETELAIIYHEIKLAIRKLGSWSKTKRVSSGLSNFPGKSFIIAEPYGNVLVIGAWNYPYQLSILPAVSALAAGNTVVIKPSELSLNASQAMAKIINDNFEEEILHVIEGGVEETTVLLKHPFDFIFYTGSTAVGKIIMHAASENLTPVALELGGKSPAIIDADANIKMAAKRIVWGKFLNGGQTCVAPDYLLVHQSIKKELILEIENQIKLIHGENPMYSEAFVRIINHRHFQRLIKLIDKEKIIIGGNTCENELYIDPIVLDNISFDDEVMQEEIFGPILPIITYEDLDWAIAQIKDRPKPLALYLFSNTKKVQQKVLQEISFGGGAINDVIMQLANSKLPFGGVGHSGMGNYHGEYGFKTFSHHKSIIKKTNWFEPWFKYPPYTKGKLELIRKILG
ncbi:MAG: aldehyde dehydrogenase [Bacteroidales bacterium]|jgi:aldehyde dehydrogenase (NAD+)|nr:aldehyde dehydrogenase [Bacteroidales bacterium]